MESKKSVQAEKQTNLYITICSTCDGEGVNKLYKDCFSPIYGDMPNFCDCLEGQKKENIFKRDNDLLLSSYNSRIKNELFVKSGIPKRYTDASIADLKDPMRKIVSEYCSNFSTISKNGWGFFIWGDVGVGKTHTASVIGNTLIETCLIPVLFTSIGDLSSRVRLGIQEKDSGERLWHKAQTADFLILDDFGTERSTDWVKENVYLTINARYESKLPTVITSNQSLEDISKTYSPQISSRIREANKILFFAGEDLRKSKKPHF